VDSHLLSQEIPMYSAGVAGWLRFHETFYPGNITIGNATYAPFNYEITDLPQRENATLIKVYNVTNEASYEEGREIEEAEPTSISEIFSGLGSQNDTPPEKINLYLYRLNNTLPDVFIVRDNEMIPLDVTKITPHKIVASSDSIMPGDIIVFKNSWYKGWKYSINGQEKKDTEAYQRLISFQAVSEIENATISFTFEPSDFVLGLVITVLFFPAIVLLYIITRKGYLFILVTGSEPDS
jgi:hypothetical protein